MRRLLTTLLACLGIIATALVAASPAYATVFQTYGSGVNVRADEAYLSSPVVTTLPGPTSIDVDCQKEGDLVSNSDGNSRWWAHVPALGGYVTVVYVAIPEDKLPGVPECDDPEPPGEDVTLADVQAMFGSRIANPSIVQTGLPSLNQAMRDANINTPYRKAAFLATLVHELLLEYNIREIGDTRPYGGRGFTQLTGDFNYGPAGQYFGIDLLGNPDLAMSLQWSAPIARWYWTVARPTSIRTPIHPRHGPGQRGDRLPGRHRGPAALRLVQERDPLLHRVRPERHHLHPPGPAHRRHHPPDPPPSSKPSPRTAAVSADRLSRPDPPTVRPAPGCSPVLDVAVDLVARGVEGADVDLHLAALEDSTELGGRDVPGPVRERHAVPG